jgi:hypothetical protein
MRGHVRFTAALLAAAATAPLAAQPMTQPRFWVVHREMARPSMIEQYEATTKEFLGHVQAHRDAIPGFSYTAFMADDMSYYFVAPIANFAAMDSIYGGFMALAGAVGEAKWMDLMQRGGATTDYVSESVVMEDPSLSYTPANPRLKEEEKRYFNYALYYVQPGRENDADALAKEFVALYTKKNVAEGYHLLKVAMGAEMPLYIAVTGAKDPVDWATQDMQVQQALGDEGKALFARAAGLSRRVEIRTAWVRPDLSLPPVMKK